MSQQNGTVIVGCIGPTVVVRVEGAGTLFNSQPLQAFIRTALDSGAGEFVFDLEACSYVDSTFLGVMAGLAQRLSGVGKPKPQVVNASEPLLTIMRRVGLPHLVEIGDRALAELEAATVLEPVELTKLDRGRHMLYAHLQLSELSPDNEAQFATLVATLKANVARHERED